MFAIGAVPKTRPAAPGAPVFIAADKPRGASGVGLSREDALRRAQGEAVELASIWWWGDEPTIVARGDQLVPSWVAPEDILLYHPEQYTNRDHWVQRLSPWEQVPSARRAGEPIHWIEARDLSDGSTWLPAACCFLAYPQATETAWAIADSNGCAAGATRAAAITAAILECVEREAVAIWWHHAGARPGVEVRGSLAPRLQHLWAWLESRERCHHVLDLRTDLDLPVLAAISCDAGGGDLAYGFGADPDPQTALESALLEMLQDELMLHMMGPGEEATWRERITTATCPHLAPARETTSIDTLASGLATHDLSVLAQRCADRGLRPVVLDLTRAAIGVPAVRVVVPGMRHYRLALAPGRLYDVPRRLGRRTRSYAEIAADALMFPA